MAFLPAVLTHSEYCPPVQRLKSFIADSAFAISAGESAADQDGNAILQPMQRPTICESANSSDLRIFPAQEEDVLPLAHMHNASFADDAFMQLIWGNTDRPAFDRELAKDFSHRRACVQKGIAPGFEEPVGMTLAYLVDVDAERAESARSDKKPEEEEKHLPGTDVELFKDFMAMLDRVRAAYREQDSRFYHLEILAVAPEAQRRGFGQALLESVLATADEENLPVYLEASAVGTGLYRKHGFVDCAERASCGPEGAISVLPMRRPPRAARQA
ncbi:hypothetical protein JCM10908_005128 [Rhodotorula pacifica]|uniref:GNAT family N-acetyltransferase n=1 Tax=Rhodotorula pacifica TaxID=1495444 RepID=UPI00316C5BDA